MLGHGENYGFEWTVWLVVVFTVSIYLMLPVNIMPFAFVSTMSIHCNHKKAKCVLGFLNYYYFYV